MINSYQGKKKQFSGILLNIIILMKASGKFFPALFSAGVKGTFPLVLKVYENSKLCGATILIKCSRYGRSLFNNRILSGMIDFTGIPFYLWIKFGCCMDMMSNPGFIEDPEKSNEIYSAIASFLKSNSILTIINDYSDQTNLYPSRIEIAIFAPCDN